MCTIRHDIGDTYLKEAIAAVLYSCKKSNYITIENLFSFPIKITIDYR